MAQTIIGKQNWFFMSANILKYLTLLKAYGCDKFICYRMTNNILICLSEVVETMSSLIRVKKTSTISQ